IAHAIHFHGEKPPRNLRQSHNEDFWRIFFNLCVDHLEPEQLPTAVRRSTGYKARAARKVAEEMGLTQKRAPVVELDYEGSVARFEYRGVELKRHYLNSGATLPSGWQDWRAVWETPYGNYRTKTQAL